MSEARLASRLRAKLYWLVATLYLSAIYGGPAALLGLAVYRSSGVVKLLVAVVAPGILAAAFVLIAGLLSRLHSGRVEAGELQLDLGSRAYFHRRLYGLCWTAVYYSGPVYFLVLAFPPAKHAMLRLFGYQGNTEFTFYPDTWVRDLPLLSIGKGAYLSNKATIGSNIVMADGTIIVDRIEIGPGALIGHLAVVGPGLRLGAGAQVGVAAAIGIATHIGDGSAIGPCCAIEHSVRIGANTRIGTHTYVGTRAVLGDDLIIPPGSVIPPRTRLRTQDEVRDFCSAGRPAIRRVP